MIQSILPDRTLIPVYIACVCVRVCVLCVCIFSSPIAELAMLLEMYMTKVEQRKKEKGTFLQIAALI